MVGDDLLRKLAALREMDAALREREKTLLGLADENPLAAYRPTMPGETEFGDPQYLFHSSLAKERIAFGGNRSGKTECGAAETDYHITGEYPEWYPRAGRLMDGELRQRPLRIRIYSTSYEKGVNDVVWPKLAKYLPRALRVEPRRNTSGGINGASLPNGVEISILTYEQKSELSVGWDGHLVWFDEPPPNERIYLEAARGTLDRNGRVYITATPMDCEWLDQALLDIATKDPTERYKPFAVYLDIRDNKHIPAEEVEWWLKRLPKEEYMARVTGRPTSIYSRVYLPFLNRDTHIIQPFLLPTVDGRPDGWCLYQGVDPHDAKPAAMVWWAVFDPALTGGRSRIIQVAESWDEEAILISASVARIRDIERRLGTRATARYMDPNFGAKTSSITGRTIQGEYNKLSREAGYPMNFRLADDALAYGHEQMRKLLTTALPDGTPQLTIFNTCTETVQSLMRYKYKDIFAGKILDNEYKHFADACRYLATAKLRYVPPEGARDLPLNRWSLREHLARLERSEYIPDPVTGY